MISYEQVQFVMPHPPSVELVELFNDLSYRLREHPGFVDDHNPYIQLQEVGKFCLSATSIQQHYIAFILGKHVQNAFPEEVIDLFFSLDIQYKLQYSKIEGNTIDGCICLIHQDAGKKYDLQQVYDHIYS